MTEERKAVDSQEYEARLNGDRAALKIIDSQRDRIRYLEAQVAELRDLSNFINAADISAADAPHTVVEKLQRAMLKGKP